jgi:ferrous iron transport protein B
LFSGDTAPFVMELPAYHWPSPKNLLRNIWERAWSFVKKAGTVILLSSIVIWFLQNFGFANGKFGMVKEVDNGLLAIIGNILAPLFAPLGWGHWKAAVATITGLIAKENVVSTFGVLYGFAEVAEDGSEYWGALATDYTTLSAYSFLVFNLLCAPCFAAVGAIKREMNNRKWTWFALGYQTGLAYVVSLCIYQFGSLLAGNGFGIGTLVAIVVVVVFLFLLFRPNKDSKHYNPIVSADSNA